MCFLDALCSVLQNVSNDDYLFLGGDFNCTVSNCDRNHIEPHMPSRKRLIQIINKHELSDVWRFFMRIKSNILGHMHVIMSYRWQDWIDFMCLNIMLVFLKIVVFFLLVSQIIAWCSVLLF